MTLRITAYGGTVDLGYVPALGPYAVEADGIEVGILGALAGPRWRWDRGQWPADDPFTKAVIDGIERYFAEKAKRSVTVSAATMRPMSEAPFDGTRVLLLDGEEGRDGRTGPATAFFDVHDVAGDRMDPSDGTWNVEGDDVGDPKGWWPLPCLDPMPAEFEGWDA